MSADSHGDTTRGPSGQLEAKQVDVTDPDDLRQELIRVAEDGDADDYETMEQRLTALLGQARKAMQDGGDE